MATTSHLEDLQYHREKERLIIGMDEAGKGAWAGPVFVGMVILPLEDPMLPFLLRGVTDSKLLTEAVRSTLAARIKEVAIWWRVGMGMPIEIDTMGITNATLKASERALLGKTHNEHFILADENLPVPASYAALHFAHSETRFLSIACASILAKVAQTDHMHHMDKMHPEYGFRFHKGYGTTTHREALTKHGLTLDHRKSFEPMKGMVDETN